MRAQGHAARDSAGADRTRTQVRVGLGEEDEPDRRAPPVSAREGKREGRVRLVGLGRATGGPCEEEKGGDCDSSRICNVRNIIC
jgi:hypothetical protein